MKSDSPITFRARIGYKKAWPLTRPVPEELCELCGKAFKEHEYTWPDDSAVPLYPCPVQMVQSEAESRFG